ncbi:19550_t:CDS:2 [Funneliformis geosporum]|nr:19550_t:CDS:2 [Funneliformis geosporum]
MESDLIDLESDIEKKKGTQSGLQIARRGFKLYSEIEFDSVEREHKRTRFEQYDEQSSSASTASISINVQNNLEDDSSPIHSSSLLNIIQNYCKKDSTSKYDLAHSHILDLTPASKISKEFTPDDWNKLISDRPAVVGVEYYKELEPILDYLFRRINEKKIKYVHQARDLWENLRNIEAPNHKEYFSYNKDDWNKILWWVEHAVCRFLNAFESENNPLMQTNCHEREWFGGYLIPIFEGALRLDGRCRVPWGEVTVQSTIRRRNSEKKILEEKVERGHLADMSCIFDNYELVCCLACGGPHKYDLTKLASDEFNLPRMMKDMLDDIRQKFRTIKKDPSCLYIVGLHQYMSEVRVYLIELREVYRFHLIKTIHHPLTFAFYHNLRVSLSWAWNIRVRIELIVDMEIGSSTPPPPDSNEMTTPETPTKTIKRPRPTK